MWGGGGGAGGGPGADPFANIFGAMERQMRDMERLMFGGISAGFPFNAIEDPMANRRQSLLQQQQQQQALALQQQQQPFPMNGLMQPFGFGMSPFGSLFQGMRDMQSHAISDPNSHVFTQSTMMTWDGNGAPRVVEHSTRKAGDVTETRRAVRHGNVLEEASIGHEMDGRAHVINKRRDADGRLRTTHDLRGLSSEQDAQHFDAQFRERAADALGVGGRVAASSSSSTRPQRIAIEGSSRRNAREQPIVTLPDDEDAESTAAAHRRPNRSTAATATGRAGGPVIREMDEDEQEREESVKRPRAGRF